MNDHDRILSAWHIVETQKVSYLFLPSSSGRCNTPSWGRAQKARHRVSTCYLLLEAFIRRLCVNSWLSSLEHHTIPNKEFLAESSFWGLESQHYGTGVAVSTSQTSDLWTLSGSHFPDFWGKSFRRWLVECISPQSFPLYWRLCNSYLWGSHA